MFQLLTSEIHLGPLKYEFVTPFLGISGEGDWSRQRETKRTNIEYILCAEVTTFIIPALFLTTVSQSTKITSHPLQVSKTRLRRHMVRNKTRPLAINGQPGGFWPRLHACKTCLQQLHQKVGEMNKELNHSSGSEFQKSPKP